MQENAQKIAEFLASHPRVKKVNYAGLPGHPGRDLHYSQVFFDKLKFQIMFDMPHIHFLIYLYGPFPGKRCRICV